jgi:hypothetical protein
LFFVVQVLVVGVALIATANRSLQFRVLNAVAGPALGSILGYLAVIGATTLSRGTGSLGNLDAIEWAFTILVFPYFVGKAWLLSLVLLAAIAIEQMARRKSDRLKPQEH